MVVVVVIVIDNDVVLAVVVVGAAFFLGSEVNENRQCKVFSRVFAIRKAKNIVNINVFGRSEAQNHRIYDFFASGNKKYGI